MQAGCSERLIVREFRACTQKVDRGIVIQPSLENIFEWQVTYMPLDGVFASRILTFSVYFEGFPVAVPKVVFQKGVVHPLINPMTRGFDCAGMFTEWNVQTRVYTLINYICNQFIDFSAHPERPVPHPEALNLFKPSRFRADALKAIPDPPDPIANSMNRPKSWTPQKERIAKILVALGEP